MVMSDTGMVKLIVSVPRALKEGLDALAREDDRPLASVVRRLLAKGLATDETFRAGQRVAPAEKPHGRISTPIGGQDAAAGKGVEERTEAEVAASIRPTDAIVHGGPNCTHPHRYQLGRKCEAPGCGKVVR